MKVLTGHLTTTEKKHITAILDQGLTAGKVAGKNYWLQITDNVYTVKIQQKDRGLIPCEGSELRLSTYTSTFTR
jgi:hypothetical protein